MQSFGKWAPDAAALNVALAGDISGVFPGRTAYTPWPQMQAPGTGALASACRGAFMARTTSNAIAIFAGTTSKLYKFASLASWSDFSGAAYALGTDDQWEFVQYGSNIYATNIANALQSCDVSAGIIFANVAGSPPQARYIAVVGDFLMLANTNSSSREVRWSSRNDPTTWTRYQKDADSQTFPDGGDIMGMSGFERGGLIFQTETVRQMLVRQDAAIMEFHRVEAAQGTLAPYSIVNRQGTSYYYAMNGFQRITFDGASEGIGSHWVDNWFLDNSQASTRPKAIIGGFASRMPAMFWLFASPTVASTSSIFDHMLCFDPSLTDSDFGPWTHAPVSASTIFSAGTTATTLDGLGTPGLGYAIDNVPYSLDSDVWKGGAPRLGAFDSAFKLNFFTGTPMAATLQTGLFSPVPQSRGYVNGFRVVADAAAATGRIATTERQQTLEAFGAAGTVTDQGIIYARSSGRHMRFEVTIPAGASWKTAQGISLEDDEGLVTGDGQR